MPQWERHLEDLARDGYCVIPNGFSEQFCDRATEAMHRVAREKSILVDDDAPEGRRTLRVLNLLQYDDLFQEIPLHETVLAILETYLDRECLLSGIDGIEIHPGEAAQPLHTDSWWHDDRRFDFPICVNSALALVDFTENNGATLLVPGSHLWSPEQIEGTGFFRSADDKPKGYGTEWMPISAVAPKGSLVLWDSRLLHAGGANTSGKPRPAVISPYIVGWTRQLSNFAFAIPPERARTFSPRLQELIGLACYRGHYCHVDGKSPREHLWGKAAEPA